MLEAPSCTNKVRCASCLLAALATLSYPDISAAADALAGLSLEQLSELEVTSVSKTTESLRRAPASIYVITNDDIMRAGVTSIAEALSLAPNLQVSQYTATYYVAGARGFAGAQEAQNFSNKLLILIDGRSVYSPLYSGVYLDVQDLLMEDIERIEVISGPGATLWGANAMHGVINVITRAAYLTDSSVATVALGTHERMASARIGMRASQDVSYRFYGKAFERNGTELEDGSDAKDKWHKGQFGFRVDQAAANSTLTVQGDLYRGDQDLDLPGGNLRVEGGNLLGRWQRLGEASQWQVQGYYDYTSRAAPSDGVAFDLHTLDLEVQNRRNLGRHRVVWGGGVRLHDYDIVNSPSLLFEPNARTLTLANLFVQDTMSISDVLDVSLGLKAERDAFSGWNFLPDLRLAWQVREATFLWAAASRAIRSPTPFDHDVVEKIDTTVFLTGNDDFEPERVDAFEVGLRGQPAPGLTYSVSLFFNAYDDLRTIETASDTVTLPFRWDNLMEGNAYGAEAWLEWQVTDWWRLSPGIRLLEQDLEFSRGASELLGLWQAGNDPQAQAILNSSMDLGSSVTFDATLRYVDDLPNPALPSYEELNVSVGWHPVPELDFMLTGTNLLESRHLEYPSPSGRWIPRSVLAQLRWRF